MRSKRRTAHLHTAADSRMVQGRPWGPEYKDYVEFYRNTRDKVRRAYKNQEQGKLVKEDGGKCRSIGGGLALTLPSDECLKTLHPKVEVHKDKEFPRYIQTAEPKFPKVDDFKAWLEEMDSTERNNWWIRVRYHKNPTNKEHKKKYEALRQKSGQTSLAEGQGIDNGADDTPRPDSLDTVTDPDIFSRNSQEVELPFMELLEVVTGTDESNGTTSLAEVRDIDEGANATGPMGSLDPNFDIFDADSLEDSQLYSSVFDDDMDSEHLESPERSMSIRVVSQRASNLSDKKESLLHVEPSDTLEDVKKKIHDKLGIRVTQQVLSLTTSATTTPLEQKAFAESLESKNGHTLTKLNIIHGTQIFCEVSEVDSAVVERMSRHDDGVSQGLQPLQKPSAHRLDSLKKSGDIDDSDDSDGTDVEPPMTPTKSYLNDVGELLTGSPRGKRKKSRFYDSRKSART